jgi:hypothetical protein
MIEALACGTPVIAWRRGSVPEVIDHGRTGFVVESIEEAVDAVDRVAHLSRWTCRRAFEERFDAVRMTREYLDVYLRLVHGRTERVAAGPVAFGTPTRHAGHPPRLARATSIAVGALPGVG